MEIQEGPSPRSSKWRQRFLRMYIVIDSLKTSLIKECYLCVMVFHPAGEDPIKVPRFEEAAGFYTTKQRSYNMSRVKGKNSKPELTLRRALWAKNLRFRLHDKALPGKPDIVIKKYKLAIFVDGEFWHGYNWEKNKHQIKSNKAFWIPKIERNMQKDRINHEKLREMGYTVFRFWSDEVKRNLPRVVNQIMLYVETAREIKIP
jgi:DNA mismatch endonuclease (patch repair protein)